MRIAIPVWGNKVSPVFDTSEHLLLVDIENGIEINREILFPHTGIAILMVASL